jgi:hypothetical protein
VAAGLVCQFISLLGVVGVEGDLRTGCVGVWRCCGGKLIGI